MADYDRLARLIADYPSLSIFRKFGPLTAKVLLYMQAELVHLERDLELIAEEDRKDPEKASFDVFFKALLEASREGGADLQREKIVQIQEKLRVYHATLLQVSKMQSLGRPRPNDLAFLRDWLELPQGGDFFLRGFEADIWESDYTDDLVSLSEGPSDEFARYLGDMLAPWVHHHVRQRRQKGPSGDRGWTGFAEYDDQIFVFIGDILCMMLAPLIPVVSIFALYFVKSMKGRLAVITAMSFLFSLIMTVVVRGRRVDVFAATTAFAALLAMFIGGVGFIPSSS